MRSRTTSRVHAGAGPAPARVEDLTPSRGRTAHQACRHVGAGLVPAHGSAYLISLLVMLVLTLMGLALSTLTQTELLIGSNERQIQRLFFAADAGRAASTAKALTANDYRPYEFELTEADLWDRGNAAFQTRHVIRMSPFYPAQSEICDLCDAANEMSLSEQPMHRTAFVVGSTATRINDLTPAGDELGRKTVGSFVDLHPIDPTVSALVTVIDPVTGQVSSDPSIEPGLRAIEATLKGEDYSGLIHP